METTNNGALVKVRFDRNRIDEALEKRLVEALCAHACKGNGSWFKYHTNVIVAKLTEIDYEAILKMLKL